MAHTKAVVFDFGGVIITSVAEKLVRLSARAGVPPKVFFEAMIGPDHVSTSDHPWHRIERGEIAQRDMQRLVEPFATAAGFELHGDEMDVIFEPIYRFNEPVLERIRTLRTDGYLTALLTNSVKEFRPRLEADLDIGLFDVFVDSSEVGVRKPEPEIYALTTSRLGVAADEIVYLDDFEGNVIGARAAGWTAIHVTDPVLALAELDLLLSPVTGITPEES